MISSQPRHLSSHTSGYYQDHELSKGYVHMGPSDDPPEEDSDLESESDADSSALGRKKTEKAKWTVEEV